jgi:hypothetical protein
MNKPFLSLLFVLNFSPFAHAELTATQIMTNNEDARKVAEFEARAKITTGSTDSSTKVKDFYFMEKSTKRWSSLQHFHSVSCASRSTQ